MEAEQMTLTPTAVDIRKLVGRIFAPIDLMAKKKEIDANWFVSEDVPEDLFLDEIRLRQVLTNLLGNQNSLISDLTRCREQSKIHRQGRNISKCHNGTQKRHSSAKLYGSRYWNWNTKR